MEFRMINADRIQSFIARNGGFVTEADLRQLLNQAFRLSVAEQTSTLTELYEHNFIDSFKGNGQFVFFVPGAHYCDRRYRPEPTETSSEALAEERANAQRKIIAWLTQHGPYREVFSTDAFVKDFELLCHHEGLEPEAEDFVKDALQKAGLEPCDRLGKSGYVNTPLLKQRESSPFG